MAEEIVVKLSDGTEFKGTSHEELVSKLGKAKEDTAAYASQQKQAAESAQQEAQRYKSQLEEAQRKLNPPAKKGEVFDTDTYYAMITAGDPIGAQNFLDAYRFGIQDPSQVPQTFNYMREAIDANVAQSAAAQFLARHVDDYENNQANNELMRKEMERLVQQEGFRLNPETMNYAYNQLVSSGAMKPKEKEVEEQQANPSLGGRAGAGGKGATEPKYDEMSDADLEKLIRSKGMFR